MPGLLVHLFFLLLSLVLMGLLSFSKLKMPEVKTVLLFHGFLLVFAMLANGVWSCSVWGNLYWSVDYTSDFSAFYPITRGVIDYSWGEEMSGGLRDVSLTELNFVWFGFVLVVWAAGLAATYFLLERRGRIGTQSVEPIS